MKLYTTQEVKEILSEQKRIGRSTVNKLALEANLGQIKGNSRVFTEADLEALKALARTMPGQGAKGKPRGPRQPKQAPNQP